jgi:transcriptional regulator with XRE-family HTH domain
MNDNSYMNWNSMSDKALIEMIGAFIQHHRLNQNKSQSDIAKAASISRSTLSLLERGEKVTLNSLMKVLRVLHLLHIMDVFKVNNQISPIEYAKLQKNKRSRARSKGVNPNEEIEW